MSLLVRTVIDIKLPPAPSRGPFSVAPRGRHTARYLPSVSLVSARTPFWGRRSATSGIPGVISVQVRAATEASDELRAENGRKSARMSCFRGQ